LHVDREHRFAYTYLSSEEFNGFQDVIHPARTASDMFIRTIADTDFGIVMLEEVKGELKMSIRTRHKDFGVIELCRQLGGGGHFTGGGAVVKGLPFEKAVEKVLETARKYAKENN
jgi:nanoRNase/pAp phosphatase (c-di-AMP/oligoRNAs hydrolase)